MKTKKTLIIAAFGLLSLTGIAHADDGDLKHFILGALLSDKPVEGDLTGKNADYFRSMTNAATPIHVKSWKLIQYPHNCARVHVALTQQVETKLGLHKPFSFFYELNICPSGQPAMDQTVLKKYPKPQ
jgi:hypothetical protein